MSRYRQTVAEPAPSLRERKKQRIRADILESAAALFASQGYDGTTLEQIAAGAEVSVPTVLAYFPWKEHIAFAGEWEAVERLRAMIDDPDRTENTFSIWRTWVTDTATWTMQHRRKQLAFLRMEAKSEALVRARLTVLQEWEDLLAAGLAADRGTDAETDLPTRLTATMLAFGYRTVVRQWQASRGATDLVATANAVIDFAENLVPPAAG